MPPDEFRYPHYHRDFWVGHHAVSTGDELQPIFPVVGQPGLIINGLGTAWTAPWRATQKEDQNTDSVDHTVDAFSEVIIFWGWDYPHISATRSLLALIGYLLVSVMVYGHVRGRKFVISGRPGPTEYA
jgi:hypothetical protein